jgi:hypothetical protein
LQVDADSAHGGEDAKGDAAGDERVFDSGRAALTLTEPDDQYPHGAPLKRQGAATLARRGSR